MEWRYKNFEELSIIELYSILELRSEVFVVEQNCVYQDLDGEDEKASHLFLIKNENCIAYARLFQNSIKYANSASIGRVVVAKNYRNKGLGNTLMRKSIEILKENSMNTKITISAQVYLINFYQEIGFQPIENEYLEDGIPHIKMIQNFNRVY